MKNKSFILFFLLAIGISIVLTLVLSQQRQQQPLSLESEPVLSVGDSTPAFTLVDEKGNTVSSSQYKGKVIFLHFWATWCPPCVGEIPSISKLYGKYSKNDKIKFLFVLWKDELENADQFFAEKKISLPLLFDPSMTVTEAFGVTGVPETYIIDENGILLNRFIGPAEWDTQEVTLYFDNLLR